MSVILFYSPFHQRSRDVESVMLRLRAEGHRVISLTQAEGAPINSFLRSKDIEAHAYCIPGKQNLLFYIQQISFLVRFCASNKVERVFSHLESANFAASVAQYFMQAKVYLWRHHIDEAALYDFNRSWTYRLTYKLARNIIAVSQRSVDYMINTEKIDPKKITHINLAYDFALFPQPEEETVAAIRQKYAGDILLITVCRLTKYKRPEISLEVIRKLKQTGINAHLIVLGSGDMMEDLENLATTYELKAQVFFLGHVTNVLDYMMAADYLLHPSVLESSCVVSKEAGIISKPVIVCSGIGDFDTYIVHGKNGFLASQEDFTEQAATIIQENFGKTDVLKKIGAALREDVIRLFDINNVIHQYDDLIKK